MSHDAHLFELVAESRHAQGLPPHVEDPATLVRVAQLLRTHTDTPTSQADEPDESAPNPRDR